MCLLLFNIFVAYNGFIINVVIINIFIFSSVFGLKNSMTILTDVLVSNVSNKLLLAILLSNF